MSAFAHYSQEATPAQVNSVMPASRKRKRVSMANTNGHLDENKNKKNRSKSLQPQTNGQSNVVEQPTTNKKSKILDGKFLSPAYPTPYPQRRVFVTAPRNSNFKEMNDSDEDESHVRKFYFLFKALYHTLFILERGYHCRKRISTLCLAERSRSDRR